MCMGLGGEDANLKAQAHTVGGSDGMGVHAAWLNLVHEGSSSRGVTLGNGAG